MGTSSFAVPALEALYEKRRDRTGGSGENISLLVVTQPDRVRGRGGRILPTPVGLFAEENDLRLCKPENLKTDETFLETLTAFAPELIVVAAYGKILPKALLDLPALGCVNIHASLLPAYRGAAPVQRAILDGKKEVGVTLTHMSEKLDAGDMIAFAKTDAGEMNAGELTDELAKLGAELLVNTLPMIADGTAPRLTQDESKATYADKIEKDEGRLNLRASAEEAVRKVRAMTPAPGAYIIKGGERIIVTKARALSEDGYKAAVDETAMAEAGETAKAGTVLAAVKRGIFIKTGDGILVIDMLKAPGKREMPSGEYIKGNAFGEVE